jgi:hypothetical protein
VYSRLKVLPDNAQPLQRAQLLAALFVGTEIIHLYRFGRRLGLGANIGAVATRLSGEPDAIDARASILAISEALIHPACLLFLCRSAKVRFTEIDLFGVYIAPLSLMMVAAWLVTIALRRIASHFGWWGYVWHAALFVFAVYMIVLSSMVLIAAS